MSGTDKDKPLLTGGPAVILVEPQLGENIGTAARAMANFGMSELRLVAPRDGWPSDSARASASGADHVIDGVIVFDTLKEAIADLHYVIATTARERGMNKPVREPRPAMAEMFAREAAGEKTGILFGRERWGLKNWEVALANEIVTFPVNPAFASLNIAQAVLLMAYEWMEISRANEAVQTDLAFTAREFEPATRDDIVGLLDHLVEALDRVDYFFPEERRDHLIQNLRVTLAKANFTQPEARNFRGVIAALDRRKTRGQEADRRALEATEREDD
ncbi:MAG: RNA methyltransferase [Pseudomonadota bacterium]